MTVQAHSGALEDVASVPRPSPACQGGNGLRHIDAAFERLRKLGRKALIPFIMGGDPSLSSSVQLLLALEDAGADLIEVGIPFSDPLADGPTIQEASARALAGGATPAGVLAMIVSARRRLQVPVVCLSYWNPLVQFGGNGPADRFSAQSFARAARASRVSCVIVPDLSIEEASGWPRTALRKGVAPVFLAAPTSPTERLRAIAHAARGFIYYVSVTGTTGARRALPRELLDGVRRLKRITTTPVCVGFGISTPAQASRVAEVADGVIVGSALIDRVRAATTRAAMIRNAARFVSRLRRAI